MDDGTPIELRVTIDEEKGTAVFDFEGTGPEVLGNVRSTAQSIHNGKAC
jgi:5-oxoprolinase (ATP-hydrolysing)